MEGTVKLIDDNCIELSLDGVVKTFTIPAEQSVNIYYKTCELATSDYDAAVSYLNKIGGLFMESVAPNPSNLIIKVFQMSGEDSKTKYIGVVTDPTLNKEIHRISDCDSLDDVVSKLRAYLLKKRAS